MQIKVLHITSLGYVGGGSETFIVKVSKQLLKKGFTVRTLTSDLGADKKRFNDYVFSNVSQIGLLKPLFFLFNPSSFFALRRILKEYKPDIVHFHLMNEITPSPLLLLTNYPTVMTLHAPEAFLNKLLMWFLLPSDFKNNAFDIKDLNMGGKIRYLYFNYIQKFVYKWGLKNVDVFIAPSKYMQNAARTDGLSPIVHLPNFIELGPFHEVRNKHDLLYVGRLERIKGVEFLIKAMPLIVKKFPQTTLTIVGDGRDRIDLSNLTANLQLEKHVRFVGWVENKDLDTYYERASVSIVPSICEEVFGIVILEAMSAGRPVIGSRVGGIPEIIEEGVNGYLVEPENAEQIAEKVIKIFTDGNLEELGLNARKRAEEFNIEKYVEELVKVYEEIIKKYNTSASSFSSPGIEGETVLVR